MLINFWHMLEMIKMVIEIGMLIDE
jgi:hypothetical protein